MHQSCFVIWKGILLPLAAHFLPHNLLWWGNFTFKKLRNWSWRKRKTRTQRRGGNGWILDSSQCSCTNACMGLVWWDRWMPAQGLCHLYAPGEAEMEPQLWLADFQSFSKEMMAVRMTRGHRWATARRILGLCRLWSFSCVSDQSKYQEKIDYDHSHVIRDTCYKIGY